MLGAAFGERHAEVEVVLLWWQAGELPSENEISAPGSFFLLSRGERIARRGTALNAVIGHDHVDRVLGAALGHVTGCAITIRLACVSLPMATSALRAVGGDR